MCVPTYYVYNYEVPTPNWELGSMFSLNTPSSELMQGVWRNSRNASRFDALLPFGLSVAQLSLLSPGIALTANTSEVYHSGLMLDDKLTKAEEQPARVAKPRCALLCLPAPPPRPPS